MKSMSWEWEKALSLLCGRTEEKKVIINHFTDLENNIFDIYLCEDMCVMFTGQVLLNQYAILFICNWQQSIFNKYHFFLSNVTRKNIKKQSNKNKLCPRW